MTNPERFEGFRFADYDGGFVTMVGRVTSAQKAADLLKDPSIEADVLIEQRTQRIVDTEVVEDLIKELGISRF